MLFITQLIHILPGQEAVFDEFEAFAISLIAKHGGEMILRIRPAEEAYLIAAGERPYEIHIGSFPTNPHYKLSCRTIPANSFCT